LLVGFTSDRRQVQAAIDNLGVTQLIDRNPDPLQLIAAQLPTGKSADVKAENDQDALRAATRAAGEQRQAVPGAFTRSLSDFARLLAGIHGRKEVIYLSEGFDVSVLQGSENLEEQRQIAEMTIQGQGTLTNSEQRFGNTRSTNVLETMMEAFR